MKKVLSFLAFVAVVVCSVLCSGVSSWVRSPALVAGGGIPTLTINSVPQLGTGATLTLNPNSTDDAGSFTLHTGSSPTPFVGDFIVGTMNFSIPLPGSSVTKANLTRPANHESAFANSIFNVHVDTFNVRSNGFDISAAMQNATQTLQTLNTSVAVDTTTTSTTFVDLLTITFATETLSPSGTVEITTSLGASNSVANTGIYTRITVDGIQYDGGAAERYINAPATSMSQHIFVSNLTIGSHTVSMQWRVDGGTGRCRPVSASGSENAWLIVEEKSDGRFKANTDYEYWYLNVQ